MEPPIPGRRPRETGHGLPRVIGGGTELARSKDCNLRQTRPTIPAERISVTTESRGRAWRQPWLSREAKTADPFVLFVDWSYIVLLR